ncbi:MAG: tRNA uridine-5-carboxymethylaminomethyl(34) synthesis GTPase MnmE [Bacilli bacterium]|nr:tRNA uridine-5-carboxymethylaminomethyl(34) synthesis GTPase MnmE [Bacilli bacterium]
MNDVIVAISTALGKGAISIVRLSGEGAIELVNSCFKGKDLTTVNSHTINYGYIVNDEMVIDEVLVSIMKAPKTYTKEDVVEINCHGGIASTNKILETMVLKGARLAEPGEFTKRAFLNGRIDLVKAEAVMDLINSKTEKARVVSINQLEGRLTGIIRKFRQELLELLANVEVNIDYPEYEDIEVVTIDNIKNKVSNMKKSLIEIINESESRKIIKDGINVAIVGRPNVGKSSILNRLLGENKAIVTDIAGTTRDIVEGSITINGIALNFIDTAGIRETDDVVEKFGVERSIEEIKKADLVILVLNNNEEINNDDIELINKINDKKYLVVVNKKDLDKKLSLDGFALKNIIYTDTVSTDGIVSLKEKIVELFNLDEIEQNDYEIFTNTRQITLAKESLDILKDVEIGIENDVPVDMVAIDIKRIWTKLGEILGENYSEELIDQLFSQFCLGK